MMTTLMLNPAQAPFLSIIRSLRCFLAQVQDKTLQEGSVINLEGKELGDEGAQKIVNAWKQGNCPKKLLFQLSNSQFTKASLIFADAIEQGQCPEDTVIDFGYNYIGNIGYLRLLDAMRSEKCNQGIKIITRSCTVDFGGQSIKLDLILDMVTGKLTDGGLWPSGLEISESGIERVRDSHHLGVHIDLGLRGKTEKMFTKCCEVLRTPKCTSHISIDFGNYVMTLDQAKLFAKVLQSKECPPYLVTHFGIVQECGLEGYQQIAQAIKKAGTFCGGIEFKESDNLFLNKLVLNEKQNIHELCQANDDLLTCVRFMAFLQGLRQPTSPVSTLASCHDVIRLILMAACPDQLFGAPKNSVRAKCFAKNTVTFFSEQNNDRFGGKKIQSCLSRIVAHKKRALALRLALKKLNSWVDKLALIENQLDCYEPSKVRTPLPEVLWKLVDSETREYLIRPFKKRPTKGIGGYYHLLCELKDNIQGQLAAKLAV